MVATLQYDNLGEMTYKNKDHDIPSQKAIFKRIKSKRVYNFDHPVSNVNKRFDRIGNYIHR